MTDLPEFDELLSAYLDDELSDEEKRQVEQSLRDDRGLRHALDELRSLRAAIQTLPQRKLDEGFCQRVLERAERSRFESAVTQSPQVTRPASDDPPSGATSWSQRPGLKSFAIACAALAALVLIAVVLPKQMKHGDLAQHAPAVRDESVARNEAVDGRDPTNTFADHDDRRSERGIHEGAESDFDDIAAHGRSAESFEMRSESLRKRPPVSNAAPEATRRGETAAPAIRTFGGTQNIEAQAEERLPSAPSPASGQPASQPATQVASDGLPPAAISDYVVFVSGSSRRRIGDAFRTALVQNRITEMPTPAEEQVSSAETAVQMVLVEAPLDQIQATVKTLGADRSNVQSILALSQHGDSHRVTGDASGFGESIGEDLRYDPPSEVTKDKSARVASDTLGRSVELPSQGQAWFFSYPAEGPLADSKSQTKGDMSPSLSPDQKQTGKGITRGSNDLASGAGGGADEAPGVDVQSVDLPDDSMQALDNLLRRDRESLRRRISQLQMPDAPHAASSIEAIRNQRAAKEEEDSTAGVKMAEKALVKPSSVNHDAVLRDAPEVRLEGKAAVIGPARLTEAESTTGHRLKRRQSKGRPSDEQKMVRVLFVLQPEDDEDP